MPRIAALLVPSALALVLLAPPSGADAEGEATYVLERQGPETVRVGKPVYELLTATGEDGLPQSGLSVRFVNSGPGSESTESCPAQDLATCAVTDANGLAWHSFAAVRPGVVLVRAEIYGPDGVLVAEVGPDEVTVHPIIVCRAARNYCPPVSTRLQGQNKVPGRDWLEVTGGSSHKGSTVVLMRRHAGAWSAIGRTKTADRRGRCSFSVRDDNAERRTRYRAVVISSVAHATDITNTVTLR